MDFHSSLRWLLQPLFWASPALVLLQLVGLIVLLHRVVYRWQQGRLGSRRLEQVAIQAGVVVAPVLLLALSSIFQGGYQGERGGHWLFHVHDGWAGMSLVPVYAAGSFVVGRAIARPAKGWESGTALVVLATLVAICAWYVVAVLFMRSTKEATGDMPILALVPATAALGYVLVGVDAHRHGRPLRHDTGGAMTWYASLVVSLIVKLALARDFYSKLPTERPAGYGDCFVVSAAALGHPAVVGSWYDAGQGRVVNRQLRTLRTFESAFAGRHPAWHRRLRRLYERVGPVVARRVRSRVAADLVFLVLKPIEWGAAAYLRVRE